MAVRYAGSCNTVPVEIQVVGIQKDCAMLAQFIKHQENDTVKDDRVEHSTTEQNF